MSKWIANLTSVPSAIDCLMRAVECDAKDRA